MSTTSTPVYVDPCPRCYSIPCRCYTAPQTATRVDPYFVYERIAAALERIASAMESNQDSGRPS